MKTTGTDTVMAFASESSMPDEAVGLLERRTVEEHRIVLPR
ncbi:hypothetical protein [uncultured Sutterella sp.]|nr:hypothetical protein [uncultured Sutterella sp.]